MRVEELMHAPAFTCSSHDTMSQAASLMWEHDCGTVPVVHDDGTVAGMITDRDICMAAYMRDQPLSQMGVSDSMSEGVHCCRPDDDLQDAETMMKDRQIRRMPVVDSDNRPVGVISLNDIARYTASQQGITGMQGEVLDTLASISKPRSEPHA